MIGTRCNSLCLAIYDGVVLSDAVISQVDVGIYLLKQIQRVYHAVSNAVLFQDKIVIARRHAVDDSGYIRKQRKPLASLSLLTADIDDTKVHSGMLESRF